MKGTARMNVADWAIDLIFLLTIPHNSFRIFLPFMFTSEKEENGNCVIKMYFSSEIRAAIYIHLKTKQISGLIGFHGVFSTPYRLELATHISRLVILPSVCVRDSTHITENEGEAVGP